MQFVVNISYYKREIMVFEIELYFQNVDQTESM